MANVTIRRRRLGAELRRLREANDLTCEQVAGRMECAQSTISRIELGRGGVKPRDVRDLLDIYGIEDEDRREELIELSRNPRPRSSRHGLAGSISAPYNAYLTMEADATAVTSYLPLVVDGLLQIEEYARAVESTGPLTLSDERIEANVAARMARQDARARRGGPRLWSILDESVLYRHTGGPGVLRLQLDHLRDMTDDPQTVIQVVPLAADTAARLLGTVHVLEFEPGDLPVVYLETSAGAAFIDREDKIADFTQAMDHLRAAALSPQDSAASISKALKALEMR